VAYAALFVAFVFAEAPDLGLPHFFYLPIVLVAAVS